MGVEFMDNVEGLALINAFLFVLVTDIHRVDWSLSKHDYI